MATVIETTTATHHTEHQPGQRRYKIRRLKASSDKYGPCEICEDHVSDMHYQVEEMFYRHSLGRYPEGWTHADCHSLFGHESCLRSRRRGKKVHAMVDDGIDYDVHAAPNPQTGQYD